MQRMGRVPGSVCLSSPRTPKNAGGERHTAGARRRARESPRIRGHPPGAYHVLPPAPPVPGRPGVRLPRGRMGAPAGHPPAAGGHCPPLPPVGRLRRRRRHPHAGPQRAAGAARPGILPVEGAHRVPGECDRRRERKRMRTHGAGGVLFSPSPARRPQTLAPALSLCAPCSPTPLPHHPLPLGHGPRPLRHGTAGRGNVVPPVRPTVQGEKGESERIPRPPVFSLSLFSIGFFSSRSLSSLSPSAHLPLHQLGRRLQGRWQAGLRGGGPGHLRHDVPRQAAGAFGRRKKKKQRRRGRARALLFFLSLSPQPSLIFLTPRPRPPFRPSHPPL